MRERREGGREGNERLASAAAAGEQPSAALQLAATVHKVLVPMPRLLPLPLPLSLCRIRLQSLQARRDLFLGVTVASSIAATARRDTMNLS